MKKFVLAWSVILAIALVGSAFAGDFSDLTSPKPAKSATFLIEKESGAITATNEYQQRDRREEVFRYHPSLLTVPPPNDSCENAEFIAGPFPVSGPGTTVDATIDCPGVLDWNGVWYVFDLPYASNTVFIELCPDNIDLYTVGIVLMDDCACDDYVIRDVGAFGICASGYTGYTMTFNNVPGPATWYWPAYGVDAAMQGLDFVWTIDITEPPPPPDNDSCETAEPTGDVVDLPFSTTTATASGYGTCMTSPDIWYLYTASTSGDIVVSLCGSEYDTKLAVYDSSSCDPLSPEIECNDDFCGMQSQITYTAVEGNLYLIQVGGFSSYTGDGVLSIGPPGGPPENDSCETAEAIGRVENYPFSTMEATASLYGTCMTSPDIWYVYTAEVSGSTIVSLCGSEYDTKLAVYDGSSCDPLSPEIECNDDWCGLQSQITYLAVEGNEYLIQVGGYSSSVGDGVISIMAEEPTVSMQCDLLTPMFCRGKTFYFMLTIDNPTGGEITGTLTFNGYAGYDCDPANVLNDITRNKTYPDGETQEYYFYHVAASVPAGQYSASIGGTLSGYDLFCCMNGDIVECGPFKNGNNTTWELVQVERPEVGLPTVTSLAQNYPNPFNATTNISFDLTVAGNVSLNVYDITGRLVVTLVDGQMDAGQHVVVWDASNVSSGVYFYKLTAGDYTATKKMNLLK